MLAVLVDADNLSATHAEQILDWAVTRCPHPIVRLFGDFSAGRGRDWADLALRRGYAIRFQPNGGTGKNSTDIALAIDAMDLLHEGVVTTFCLASNDRDFVPLAIRLNDSGRKVVIAAQNPGERMRRVSDEVLELPAASKPPANVVVPPIVLAYRRVAEGKDRMTLSALGHLLRKHEPGVLPPGKKVRTVFRESGWFEEQGEGHALMIVLRRSA